MFKTKSLKKLGITLAITAASLAISSTANACTTVLVGKDASNDGSTMIARNEDMGTAWAKHFVIRQANTNPTNYVSKGNKFSLTLPSKQLKYSATPEWDTSEGLYEEAGINSANVAMSGTESATTKEKVLKLDPLVENGIAEDSIVTVVLPYITSPKEGVARLGKIVEEKGAAEVNGVIFSNKEEIWYMEIVSGHHWVALRVPDNQYAVIANTLTIGDIDTTDQGNVQVSTGLKNFVETNKLAKNSEKFSVRDIFADTKEDAQYNLPRMWDGQRMLTPSKKKKITDTDFNLFEKPDEPISFAKVAYILTLHFNGTKYDTMTGSKADKYRPISVPNTMESHILQFRSDVPEELSGIHWLALGVTDTSNYVPFYSGITKTPAYYQAGTDLPDGNSAYWTYRVTNILTKTNYQEFKTKETLPLRQEVRDYLAKQVAKTDTEAKQIIKDTPDNLPTYLNEQTEKFAKYSLEKYKELNKQLLVKMTELTPTKHNDNL